ncbi:MAG: helix-turn-helix transcriptional regulator [Bacilli bacterium]|nr:helix-turn-helix transcriptional regulator [Bacilli bacterium]
MKDLREIIGANLTELRKANKLTQLDVAEKFNYGDKTVSKWEQGINLPSIEVLKELADFYGVSLDYLVSDRNNKPEAKEIAEENHKNKNKRHVFITLLSICCCWLVATCIFVLLFAIGMPPNKIWLVFCWALPASAIVAIVFNGIWGKRKWLLIFNSILLWSTLFSIYLQVASFIPSFYLDGWYLFLIGAPLQTAFIFWHKLK